MYICVKTNENLDKLVQELLRLNLAINVSRHDSLTWIEVNLKDYGYSAYVAVYSKEVIIHDLGQQEYKTHVRISFEDIETIYELE